MRSRRAGGIGSRMFAVVINITLLRSKGHLEVMVGKGVILLRVQDFQQGRRRVSPKIHSQLVDLVQHKDRVVGPGLADPLNDPPGESPDIGAAMARGSRLHLARPPRDMRMNLLPRALAMDFPTEVFPVPGGPDKTEDRALSCRL